MTAVARKQNLEPYELRSFQRLENIAARTGQDSESPMVGVP